MDTAPSPAPGYVSWKAVMAVLPDAIVPSQLLAELLAELFLTYMELNVTGQKRVTVQSNPAHFEGHISSSGAD